MDNIKVLATASLNKEKSLAEINKGIAEIQNSSSLQKLKLNLELNTSGKDLAELNKELTNTGQSAEKSSALLKGFGDALRGSFIASTLAFFKNGVTHVNELNKSLTQLSMIYSKSQEEVQQYGSRFQSLGKQLSFSSTELAKASVEIARQGLSQEETFKRLERAARFAKISNLDLASSNKILTTTMSAMKVDAVRASDVLSYLGDATSLSAAEISEASDIAGDSAEAMGISFEKAGSWIAAISSKTKDSASTVGGSIKSILSRMQTLKQFGYDKQDGTNLQQMNKALSDVNVHLMNSNGTFRNFGDVLDDLGSKWGGLTSKQKAYTATTVAGAGQKSNFIHLMDNYRESIGLYEGALNSAGSSQEKFSRWQQGTEAAIVRFKTSIQGVWQNSFDSSSMQVFIQTITFLIDIVGALGDILGPIPLLIGTVSGAMLLLSKSTRTAITQGTILTGTLGGLTAALNIAKSALRGFMASTVIGAGIAVLSFGLEKLIGLFMDVDKNQPAFDTMNNSIQNTGSNIAEMESLNDQYKNNKLSNEELLSVKEKMISIMPEVVSHYDAEGRAVLKTSGQIEELIKKEKELHLNQKKTARNLLSENLKPNAESIESNKKNVEKKANSLGRKEALAKNESIHYISQFMDDNNISSPDALSKDTEKLSALHNKITEIFNKNGAVIQNQFLSGILWNDNLSESLEESRATLEKFDKEMKDAETNFNQDASKFAEGFELISDVIFTESGKLDKSQKLFFSKFGNAFAQTTPINKDNYKEVLGEYDRMIQQMDGYLKSKKIDFGEVLSTGNVSQLEGMFKSAGLEGKELKDILDKLNISTAGTSHETTDYASVVSKLSSAYTEVSKEIKPLNQLIEDLRQGKKITSDQLAELTLKEKDFILSLVDESGEIKQNLIPAIESLRDKKIESFEDVAKAQELSIKDSEARTIKVLENYGVEIQGIKNVAEALDAISTKKSQISANIRQAGREGNMEYIKEGSEQQNELDKQKEKLLEIDKLYKINESLLEKYKNDLKKKPTSTSSPSKTSTPKTSQPAETREVALKEALELKDVTKELINSFNAEFEARRHINEEIERKIKLSEQNKAYNQAIEETTDLLDSQRQSVLDLNSANKKLEDEANKLRKNNSETYNKSEADFQNWFDVNNEATVAYTDFLNTFATKSQTILDTKGLSNQQKNDKIDALKKEQDEVQRLFDKLQSLKKAYGDNSVKINEMTDALNSSYDALIRLHKDKLNVSLTSADQLIDFSKNQMNTQEDSSADYRDELDKQYGLTKAKQAAIDLDTRQARDRIRSGKLTNEQIQKENELIRDNNKLRMAADNELHEISYTRAQSVIKESSLEAAKYADELENSKKKLGLLEEGTQAYNNELLKQGQLLLKQLDAEKRHQTSIEEQMKASDLTEAQWAELNGQLKESVNRQIDLSLSIHTSNKALTDQADKLADELIGFYKEMYGKQKEVALQTIEAIAKAQETAHKSKMEKFDEELRKFEEVTQAQIKALDDTAVQEDHLKQLGKLKAERDGIQLEIDKRKLNNSIEGQAKVAELQKQLADKNNEIDQLVTNYSRDQQKKNLQEKLDDLKTYTEEQQKLENKTYENNKELLDQQKESVELTYEQQINDEQKFAAIKESIRKGNIEAATKGLTEFTAFIKGNMSSIGENISNNLLNKISQFTTDLTTTQISISSTFMQISSDLDNTLISKLDVLISKFKEINSMKPAAFSITSLSDQDILNKMKQNSASYNETNDPVLRNSLHADNQSYMAELKRRGLDINFDSSTGEYTTPNGGLYKTYNPFNMPNDDFKRYLQNKKDYENETDKSSAKARAAAEQNIKYRDHYNIASDDYTYDELKAASRFQSGGMTPAFGPSPRWALLDQKEIVLKESDTSNLLKVIDVTRSVLSNLKSSLDFSWLNPFSGSSSSMSTVIQKMDIHIPADLREPGAGKRFALDFINGLEAKGVRIQT
ncbi:phage tail tape measure protein [Paenibacillus lutrae]|uniref:Phage tail tape measure protein n=1 Tax=Paenibacillus lutrae TaxID=2078573 RepID=A0A7X3K058_9BACL|nr:phage tail tape measure protein [Paenibacillus lutrae]MVP00803.1 phage tail tape measure protein [Paenibacillus lutrae]